MQDSVYYYDNLSECGACEINVQHAEKTVERLADKRPGTVCAHSHCAGRVGGSKPGHWARSSRPGSRRLDVVLPRWQWIVEGGGRRAKFKHPDFGWLTHQKMASIRSQHTDDVRLGFNEFVQCGQQNPRLHVNCNTCSCTIYFRFKIRLFRAQIALVLYYVYTVFY